MPPQIICSIDRSMPSQLHIIWRCVSYNAYEGESEPGRAAEIDRKGPTTTRQLTHVPHAGEEQDVNAALDQARQELDRRPTQRRDELRADRVVALLERHALGTGVQCADGLGGLSRQPEHAELPTDLEIRNGARGVGRVVASAALLDGDVVQIDTVVVSAQGSA